MPLFGRVSLNYRNKAWHAEFYTDFQARRAYDELADEAWLYGKFVLNFLGDYQTVFHSGYTI